MGLGCAVVLKENVDVHLSKISSTLNVNYIVLVMCGVLVLAGLLVTYIMVRMGISAVQSYYSLLGPVIVTAPAPTTGGGTDTDDDLVYASDAADPTETAGTDPTLASNLQSSDNARILASISLLKGKYAQYNAAMTDYASRVQNRVPDDLMDETILSRGNDDFRYSLTLTPDDEMKIERPGGATTPYVPSPKPASTIAS